ncbi:poly-gamma-glutamate biosynthesis protein PgsC [bacterium]|jgi:poly-gamma-glutamate biosynthesis protein PgsC/CapC|nr:poly-gamma-glutamate biosynthesis protein PgsC [bacterium]MBT4292101.1 poly-gamma-glutamate biosynthesis protein PgsC [bacterium]MBT7310145.1 poly-gamma-glutamate biosynthesis protein PgsC [bacterium]
MIYQAIGLGLVISLIFSEVMGVAAGGLIVPGYIALYLDQPLRVAGTILAAILTFGSVKILGRFILLYGRRTMVFSVLIGFIFGYLTRYLLVVNAMIDTGIDMSAVTSIGYIIPGLIAYWMNRQGVLETLCTMLMASFIVRLALVLAHGGRLIDVTIG